MNKLKKFVLVLCVFVSGFVAGGLTINYFEMQSRQFYRDHMRGVFNIEQEMLASISAKQGNKVQELIHRWNALNSYSSKYCFKVFRPDWNELDNCFYLPLFIKDLSLIGTPLPFGNGRSDNILELINRGKYAYTLEEMGYQEAANKEYSKILALFNDYTLARLKKRIHELIISDNNKYNDKKYQAILKKL